MKSELKHNQSKIKKLIHDCNRDIDFILVNSFSGKFGEVTFCIDPKNQAKLDRLRTELKYHQEHLRQTEQQLDDTRREGQNS